jgi:arsenate reductase
MVSDTFAGIAPVSAPAFIAAQVIGGLIGWGIANSLNTDDKQQHG